MVENAGQFDGGLMPELLAGFGYFPPSLFGPMFEWRLVTQELIGSTTAQPTLPSNSNRWAICQCASTATFCYVQPVDPIGGMAPMIYCAAESFVVVTFAQIGPVICQPLWAIVAPAGGCSCYEISYKPQRC